MEPFLRHRPIPFSDWSPEELSRVTYRWDRLRGGAQGLAESSWQVFALLIAIRYFDASNSLKQFIPAGMGFGLMLAPIGLSLINRLTVSISSVIAALWIGVSVALLGMLSAPNIYWYLLCVLCAQICVSQSVPLLTQIYSQNYPDHIRGSRLSTTFVISSLLGIFSGWFGGKVLDWDMGYYPAIFAVGALAALAYSYTSWRIPTVSAGLLRSRNPLDGIRYVRDDKLFRTMLIGWMFMGIGNLMMLPLMVEYLANPKYGINASNAQISAILVSTVLAARLLSTKIWGYLFDKMNVVTLRLIINAMFMLSTICLFFTTSLAVITLGALFLGAAFGGGGIMWTLYVTKIASPERVAPYMSVHSFTTGLRMVLAPILGYTVVYHSHPTVAAWMGLCMIGISTIIFLPLRQQIGMRKATD